MHNPYLMKPVEYYKDREQTYLKHLFLERYLEMVAYRIGFFYREFVYVDCFAGPWHAADEQLGDTSIRIALERLNSVLRGLAQRQKDPLIDPCDLRREIAIRIRRPSANPEVALRRRESNSTPGDVRSKYWPYTRASWLSFRFLFCRSNRLDRFCHG